YVRRPRDPGLLEHEQLGRVPELDLVLELLLQHLEAIGALLDHRHLVPLADQAARQVGADLAAAGDDQVHAHLTSSPLRRPQSAPSRASASSFSSTAVTSHPSPSRRLATAEPTRPHPITIAFTSSAYRGTPGSGLAAVLLEGSLRESDDEHLAGCAPQHVLDR